MAQNVGIQLLFPAPREAATQIPADRPPCSRRADVGATRSCLVHPPLDLQKLTPHIFKSFKLIRSESEIRGPNGGIHRARRAGDYLLMVIICSAAAEFYPDRADHRRRIK